MPRRVILAVLAVFVATGFPFAGSLSRASGPGASPVGKAAQEFEGKTTDGGTFRLSEALAGNGAVVMAFWGIRCGACIEEIPSLNRIQAGYGGRGVRVVGVNVDGVDAAVLKEAMQGMGIRPEYTVMADPELAVMDKFSVRTAPTTCVVGKTGKVEYFHEGYAPGDEKGLEEAVAKALVGGK